MSCVADVASALPAETKPDPLPARVPIFARLLPSLTDLAFLIPILFLFIHLDGAKTLLGDGDTGWHIRTGEWILSHHSIPQVDLFSFSKAGQPWFAWEWLWDVTFALIHSALGLAGVVLANVLILGAVFALLFRAVQRKTENDVLAIAVTIAAMAASSIHWLARPHLMGWLLLLIFDAVLQRARDGDLRRLWLLPVLTVVWTNVHGSFFIGIALLVAYAVGEMLQAQLWGSEIKYAHRFIATAIMCAAGTLVNPYGIGLHRHELEYLLDTKQLQYIGEYQSLSFHAPGAVYFESILFLALFAVCRCANRRRVAEAAIVAVWAHLALLSCRNIAIFAFFAAPPIAAMLQDVARTNAGTSGAALLRRLARGVRDLGVEHRTFERAWRFHLLPALAFGGLVLLFAAPTRPASLRAEYDPRNYPAAALKVLEAAPSSRIFADDEWGDYLIYKLYPRYRVFVDGRSDFYGAEMDEQMLNALNARFDWTTTLARYRIDTVLLRADAPLGAALKESRRWRLVYDDGIATVFRAQNSGEQSPAVPTPVQTELQPIRAKL